MLQSEEADVKPSLTAAAKSLLRPGNRAQRRRQLPVTRASLWNFLRWYQGYLDLEGMLAKVPDGRNAIRTRIPLPAVLLALLCMFWLDLGSVKALDDRLKASPDLRALLARVGWDKAISDDTFADALEHLDLDALRGILHQQGRRALKHWRTGRYLACELAQRLKPLGAAGLSARAVVALDGHELFASEHRCCEMCHEREVPKKRGGEIVKVKEYFHKVVVAQWVGVHPAVILDVEPLKPGEGELTGAYRLVERLGKTYGKVLGILLADDLYNCQPFRKVARDAGYHVVTRCKKLQQDPGKTGSGKLERRDPDRKTPDQRHVAQDGRRYACWGEDIPEGGLRYVEVRRTDTAGNTQVGALITDLPAAEAPLVALAFLFERRWWIENTGFHELAGTWSLDRAFVHAGRPTAARAIVVLALAAYNAFQVYVYEHLGLDPARPARALRAFQRDFLETLTLHGGRRGTARAP